MSEAGEQSAPHRFRTRPTSLLAALYPHSPRARSSLCALEALRGTLDGASMTIPGGVSTPRKACHNFPHVLGASASITGRSSHATGLRPFVVNRNICNFLWYGGFVRGVVGEGLRSVEVTPSPNQERVLYPARRSPFIEPGLSGSGLYTALGRAFSFVSPANLVRPARCPVVRCAGPRVVRP
jgi:hypothetical protein